MNINRYTLKSRRYIKQINDYIAREFGSKQGLAKYLVFYVFMKLGIYRKFGRTYLSRDVGRLVFICAGNICRSPLADKVAKAQGYPSCSYGLDTRGGDRADFRAIQYGHKIGISLEDHRTNSIMSYSPRAGDLLVVMEPKHISMIEKLNLSPPIALLGLYATKNRTPYIHDPYNTCDEYFFKAERKVVMSVQRLLKDVQRIH